MYVLIDRSCANEKCTNTFKAMPNDTNTVACSLYCFDRLKGMGQLEKSKRELMLNSRSYGCQKKATSTNVGESGTAAALGRQNKSKNISSTTANERKPQNHERRTTKENDLKKNSTLNITNNAKSDQGKLIMTTENTTIKNESNGAKKTESSNGPQIESGIQETAENAPIVIKSTNAEKTQQSDFTALSETLKAENESSIQLLSNTAKRLIDYADQLAAPRKVDDGEIIQRSATHELDIAVKCLSEARNVMKTKLEFLKFGKELLS